MKRSLLSFAICLLTSACGSSDDPSGDATVSSEATSDACHFSVPGESFDACYAGADAVARCATANGQIEADADCQGSSIYECDSGIYLSTLATTARCEAAAAALEGGPVEREFSVEFDDSCAIEMSTVAFLDPQSGEPLPESFSQWSSCWMDWSGTGTSSGSAFEWTDARVRIALLAPGSSGSRNTPGPRWLDIRMSIENDSTVSAAAYLPTAEQDQEGARVVYVDTDDPTEAEEAAEQYENGVVARGAYWAEASGPVEVTSSGGVVAPSGGASTEVHPDGGSLTLDVNLDGLELTLLDGTEVDVEGGFSVSGDKMPEGGSNGEPDGGTPDVRFTCRQVGICIEYTITDENRASDLRGRCGNSEDGHTCSRVDAGTCQHSNEMGDTTCTLTYNPPSDHDDFCQQTEGVVSCR